MNKFSYSMKHGVKKSGNTYYGQKEKALWLMDADVNRIDIESSDYPRLLRQIKDPPRFLYFRGNWNTDIFSETVSVVGSRKMTGYGEIITDGMVGEIAGAGITVISGFMYGIDARAHTAALDAGGKTIAVMPCGIDRVHPEYQAVLHRRISDSGGLIVSEYPGYSPPALWTYPRRNRIIAGLAPVLIVIEAGLKSGALITAGIASRYNKRIFAVPGPLTSSVSRGTALLISRGASILTCAGDVLIEYGKTYGSSVHPEDPGNLNDIQRKIIDILSHEPLSADALTRITGTNPSRIGAELTILNLNSRIILKDGKYYLKQGC